MKTSALRTWLRAEAAQEWRVLLMVGCQQDALWRLVVERGRPPPRWARPWEDDLRAQYHVLIGVRPSVDDVLRDQVLEGRWKVPSWSIQDGAPTGDADGETIRYDIRDWPKEG